jgi:hypothetical protein
MTPFDYMVLTISVTLSLILAVIVLLALVLHERREFKRMDLAVANEAAGTLAHEQQAQYRERRAIERHDREMAALEDNRRLTLAAIDQRSRLERRVQALESHPLLRPSPVISSPEGL